MIDEHGLARQSQVFGLCASCPFYTQAAEHDVLQALVLRDTFHCVAIDFTDQGDSDPAPSGDSVVEHFALAALTALQHVQAQSARCRALRWVSSSP